MYTSFKNQKTEIRAGSGILKSSKEKMKDRKNKN